MSINKSSLIKLAIIQALQALCMSAFAYFQMQLINSFGQESGSFALPALTIMFLLMAILLDVFEVRTRGSQVQKVV